MRSLGSVVPAEICLEVHWSPWVGLTFEASPDNAGGGVPPLRRWGALRTEPPPRVPGMRLYVYLRYALVCTDMNGTLPKWTNSEPGCVLRGYMLG